MNAALLLLPLLLGFALRAAPPAKTFQIIDAGIHQSEDGPLPAKGTTFVPGEAVFFSCRLDGYQMSPSRKVAIEYRFSALDPAGIPVAETVSSKIATELAPEDKDWKPKIRQTVLVPPLAETGVYKIQFSAKDELSGSAASVELTFQVQGQSLEPSETLVVRNFRFYRRDDDQQPLSLAAYRPGDTVWGRFDISGYKFGAGNRRDVAYTVAVSGPGGRALLAPREPSVDQGSSFYPMKYLPCTISLTLQRDIRPGEYLITIAVEDRTGHQTTESKQTFRVE